MKEHYASIELAREVVEWYLKAWEIETALNFGRGEIRFIYENARVIDRNPPPPGASLELEVADVIITTEIQSLTLSATRREYPKPPSVFRISPDVIMAWQRYGMYLDGKEPLQAMGYFCLTLLEVIASGKGPTGRRGRSAPRSAASQMFAIEYGILDQLGELTSTKGDPLTARKFPPTRSFVPLTDRERNWLEAVVKQIIRRLGEYSPGQTPSKISMAHLPPLSP